MLVYLFPLAAALGITNDPNNFYEGSFPSIANMLSFGTWLGYTLIAGALFSNMGVYLVYIHTSSNALCSLAEKGDAPNIFGWKLFRFNTPWFAVFFLQHHHPILDHLRFFVDRRGRNSFILYPRNHFDFDIFQATIQFSRHGTPIPYSWTHSAFINLFACAHSDCRCKHRHNRLVRKCFSHFIDGDSNHELFYKNVL